MSTFAYLVICLMMVTFHRSVSQHIFCPHSRNDDTRYKSVDYGLNIYKKASYHYAADCYLRYSLLSQPAHALISHWIHPHANTVVFIHGWQKSADGTHQLPDRWSDELRSECKNQRNDNHFYDARRRLTEKCPPNDEESQFWIDHGFNVLMVDWRYFADEDDVKRAERKMYTAVHDGQTVIDLIYDKLTRLLFAANWDGAELRFVGNSLGAQFALLLAAKFKYEANQNPFGDKLRRIALLDHYYSNYGKDYLPNQMWAGEYARLVLLPIIAKGRTPAIIENYRTTLLASTPFTGDENVSLNKQTIFVELKPWFYGVTQVAQKHLAAFRIYMHCYKFAGFRHADENAPRCSQSTSQLIRFAKSELKCPMNDGGGITGYCAKRLEQKSNSGAYTTFDTDDEFKAKCWRSWRKWWC